MSRALNTVCIARGEKEKLSAKETNPPPKSTRLAQNKSTPLLSVGNGTQQSVKKTALVTTLFGSQLLQKHKSLLNAYRTHVMYL